MSDDGLPMAAAPSEQEADYQRFLHPKGQAAPAEPPATALTSASVEAEGLDVERLARVLTVEFPKWASVSSDPWPRKDGARLGKEFAHDMARAIAAAYATPDASEDGDD